MPDNPKLLKKVAWMPVAGKKVLFARSKKEPILFYCVGGKIEEGETEIEALIREVREETKVQLDVASIKHFKNFVGPSHTGGQMEMIIYEGEPMYAEDLVPSGEIAELAWFTSADVYRTTQMGKIILDWYKKRNLID